MDNLTDDTLLEELNKRFLDNKKALHAMRVMNEQIGKLNTKLAESERVKTTFLSNIRNEINNPLTAILGMAQSLAGPLKDESARREMASMIYHEAFDLDFQLRNIFIAAELEAGETTLNKAHVDVVSLIKSVIRSFEHKAREKNVTVDFACPGLPKEDGGCLFTTDPQKFHVVTANLLANAIEFNRSGKKVSIFAKKENNFLSVSVEDEGIGIPEQERERLFERFHQLDQGPSKKHKGHGLGLCITKAIVELLGGKISVAQAGGGGALFQVVIPEATGVPTDVFSQDGNEFLFDKGAAF